MIFSKQQLWERFQRYFTEFPTIGLSVDLSRSNLDERFIASMQPRLERAFADMAALEAGGIANPDEGRMVGHYWLRDASLAPTPEIRRDIVETVNKVRDFAADIHRGILRGAGGPFKNHLLIGIGGSALGPQFVAHALGHPATDKLRPHFLDNTDPDGMERVLANIGPALGTAICLVVSKSGGTKETRNGMIEVKSAFEAAGLDFSKHAVAVTRSGSALDKYAETNGWLGRFPMWDWVGGRTSEMSAVGLLPAAIQGIQISELLSGARACDNVTRVQEFAKNPAAQLALAWFRSGNGRGEKCMVVLPYKDRLELLSRYLQQLVMESLGKEKDLAGAIVRQGITVLGNKGSTDQHSYIQQLMDGLYNSFVLFINVLRDGRHPRAFVEEGAISGDFINGFFLGTKQALSDRGRESLSMTIHDISPFSIGVLIALFERAVGFYASLVGINAYHQPGVEAGKKAAEAILSLQMRIIHQLEHANGNQMTVGEIADALNVTHGQQQILSICERLSANQSYGIRKIPGKTWLDASFGWA